MNKDNSNYKGFFTLLFGGFLYSLYGVFSRIIGTSLPQFFQIWSRAAIILVFLFALVAITKTKLIKIKKSDWIWVLLGGGSTGLLLPLFYIAVNKLAIGTTLFSFYAISTVVSYVLGGVLFKEKLNRIKIISLFVAILGLFFIYFDALKIGEIRYILFSGLSGALFGLSINSIKKINNTYSSLQVNIFNWLGALIINLIVSVLLGEHLSFTFISIPWAANFGLSLCSFAASSLVVYGLKFIEMQKGSIVLLSELVFGVLLGLFIYKEVPSTAALFGNILILIALILPNLNVGNKIVLESTM